MTTQELRHGHLVGASISNKLNLEPWLVVNTDRGFRFVRTADVGVRPIHGGPHIVFPSVICWAEKHGHRLEELVQITPWSECRGITDAYDIIAEAEQILAGSIDPAYELSQWLKTAKQWPGSSASVIKDRDGAIAGAFVTLHTSNAFILRALLKWLGVPQHIIASVTGIERN